jgi:hypothetical protein
VNVRRFLILALLLSPAAARAAEFHTSPALTRPVRSTRDEMLAQIGGRSGGSTTEKEKPAGLPAGEQKISPRKAMLYSLLLPGLGQQAAGRDERARVFYAIEAGIWTSFAIFQIQGHNQEERFIEYAEMTAGVEPDDKDDDYWREIANFERSDPGPGSANELVRRQARALYPGDKEKQDQYVQDNGYFGADAWDWQNADNLARYADLRSKSLDSYDKAQISIFAALANRLVSVIDAARVARQANTAAAGQSKAKETLVGEALEHFTIRMQKDGSERVPVLAWRTRF